MGRKLTAGAHAQEKATFPVPNAVNSLLATITRVMRRLHRVRQSMVKAADATAQSL